MSQRRARTVLVAVSARATLARMVAAIERDDPLANVAAADSGEAVFARLRSDSEGSAGAVLPRLILLDMGVEGPTGLEVVRRLRECPRTRLLPIVALTSSVEQVQPAYDAGVNSCVQMVQDTSRIEEAVPLIVQYWLNLNQLPLELGRSAVAE